MKSTISYLLFVFYSTVLLAQQEVQTLGTLPDLVSETSGLLFHNGKLITHNDSGNSPQLYEIDTVSLEITRTVTLNNAENIDWEDSTQDTDYFYIGDFGNNLGTRTDLVIYRISKELYNQQDEITAERIHFSYEDQTTFEDTGNSDWDAEALIAIEDQLLVFTKQWQSNGTVAYTIPKAPGTHIAKRLDSFDTKGLVTGAVYNPESRLLYLVGYSAILDSFLYRVDGASNTAVFDGEIEQLSTNIGFAQVEAIVAIDVDRYMISSELFTRENPFITLQSTLYALGTNDRSYTDPDPNPDPDPDPDLDPDPDPDLDPDPLADELILYRSIEESVLWYEVPDSELLIARAIFDVMGRLVTYDTGPGLDTKNIDLSTLPKGIFYITFYFGDRKTSRPFANY